MMTSLVTSKLKTKALKSGLLNLLIIPSVSLFAIACGSSEETYELKSPASQVYRYNASGGSGIQGTWLNPIGAKQSDGSVVVRGLQGRNQCIVQGPNLPFRPGPSNKGHISAQVDLQISGGAITVELISAGSKVHDRKRIDVPHGQAVQTHTVNLGSLIFDEPVHNVEIRVCRPESYSYRVCEDISATRPNFCYDQPTLFLKVSETRLIYN